MMLDTGIKQFLFSVFAVPAGFGISAEYKRRRIGRNQKLCSGGAAKAAAVVVINGEVVKTRAKTKSSNYAFKPFGIGGIALIQVASIPPFFPLKNDFGYHAKKSTRLSILVSSTRKAVVASNFVRRGFIGVSLPATQIKGFFKRIKGFSGGLKTALLPYFGGFWECLS